MGYSINLFSIFSILNRQFLYAISGIPTINGESKSGFGKFKSQNVDVKKVLTNRINLESLADSVTRGVAGTGALSGSNAQYTPSGKGAGIGGAVVDAKASRNKAERVLDSAAVLMSRQLREMCEGSMRCLSDLFNQLNDPVIKQY